MKMLLKSKVCGFCEQCMDPLVCTIQEKINNHGLKKIKKKKEKKKKRKILKTQMHVHSYPNHT